MYLSSVCFTKETHPRGNDGKERTMTPPQVRLIPMTNEEIEQYLERDLAVLARENVLAGYWGEEEALERARKAHHNTLPQGAMTAGHHFFHAMDSVTNEKVGLLWIFHDLVSRPPTGFIYDLVIDEGVRRRGYGEATMHALEDLASEAGLRSIGLHVYGHNHAACRLYEKLGYTVRSFNMIKPLEQPAPSGTD
jgi:ribosomal protein S18 acetylase RimI-like enzyme